MADPMSYSTMQPLSLAEYYSGGNWCWCEWRGLYILAIQYRPGHGYTPVLLLPTSPSPEMQSGPPSPSLNHAVARAKAMAKTLVSENLHNCELNPIYEEA
jgi:hypothetical protein